MPLQYIEQTSKTLLLDDFTGVDTTPSLYGILADTKSESKSIVLQQISEQLEVSSFDEFMERFTPRIWEWFQVSPDGSGVPEYYCSLEKPMHIQEEFLDSVPLDKNEFYQMVMNLYRQRRDSNKPLLEFDYSLVEELLSPSQIMKEAKQLRADLQRNYEKWSALPEKEKAERNRCARNIQNVRKQISEVYEKSRIGQIKLALADAESKMKQLGISSDNSNQERKRIEPPIPCRIGFAEDGEVIITRRLEAPESSGVAQDSHGTTNERNELALVIAKDYDRNGHGDDYLKELIVSNYAGSRDVAPTINPEEVRTQYKQYLSVYQAAQERFVYAVSRAVEKILGVRAFFDEAAVDGRLRAPLIVANCEVSSLLADDMINRFEWLIEENTQELTKNHIWFAIVPGVGDLDFMTSAMTGDIDPFGDNTEDYVEGPDGQKRITLESLSTLLNIMRKGKIMTFFNYCAGELTGFDALDLDVIQSYKDKLSGLRDNPYAVFCYPNFTVLPKRKACIEIGRVQDGNEGKSVLLDLPGIYVDASFVAAGLVAAIQDPRLLHQKGFTVDNNLPGVRFDIEEGDNRFLLQTVMSQEQFAAVSKAVEDSIAEDMFGFSFSGEPKVVNGRMMRNAYVRTARTLNQERDGLRQPIFERLTMDFIMQLLKLQALTLGGKISAEEVNRFLKKYKDKWRVQQKSEEANRIQHENEDLSLEDDQLRITFNGAKKLIDIDIEKNAQPNQDQKGN